MDVKDGKAFFSMVMKEARNISRKQGSKATFGKGTIRAAAYLMWQSTFTQQPFAEWWCEVHLHGRTMTTVEDHTTVTGVTATTTKNESISTRKTESLYARYRTLMLKHDLLAPDEVYRNAWQCGNSTLSSIRARLREEGFAFSKAEANTWRVTKRPESKVELPPAVEYLKALPDPITIETVAEPTIVEQPYTYRPSYEPLLCPDLVTQKLDEIIELLTKLLMIWQA